MSRTVLIAALVALAAAQPAGDATALELDESLAQSVTCRVGSYYWGMYNSKHYCVRCPDGKTSKGCTGCKADPKGSKCFAATSCATGKYMHGQGQCVDCPEGKWQSQKGKTECYGCPKGMFQPKKGMHSCYWCPVGQFQSATGGRKCESCST